jgi:hypothetical protein
MVTSGASCSVHRYYDPATATFTTVDPIVAATQQPYGYTTDDPVNRVDPAGLCDEDHLNAGDASGDPGTEGKPTPQSEWSIPGLGYSIDEAFENPASTIGRTRRAEAAKLFEALKEDGFEVGKSSRGDGTRAYDGKGRLVILEPNDGKPWHAHLGPWYWRVSTGRGPADRYPAR